MAKNNEVDERSLEDKIADGIAKAMEKALPAMAQAAVQTQISAQDARHTAIVAARPTGERCQECKQVLPAGVKQGDHKHKKIAVYPKSPKHGKWFQGIRINGVLYLSNNRNHLIYVPHDFDESLIENWENNEEVLKEGRDVEHNSGDVSSFHPADHTAGWR